MGQDVEHVAPVSRPPKASTTAHHHWPDSIAASISSHLAAKPPLGGRPMSDMPPKAKASTVIRQRAGDAAEAGDAVVAEGTGDEARSQEHRGLGQGVRDQLEHAAGPGAGPHGACPRPAGRSGTNSRSAPRSSRRPPSSGAPGRAPPPHRTGSRRRPAMPAAGPRPASARSGSTSNHRRTIRKNDALTTSAESTALAAAGAPA